MGRQAHAVMLAFAVIALATTAHCGGGSQSVAPPSDSGTGAEPRLEPCPMKGCYRSGPCSLPEGNGCTCDIMSRGECPSATEFCQCVAGQWTCMSIEPGGGCLGASCIPDRTGNCPSPSGGSVSAQQTCSSQGGKFAPVGGTCPDGYTPSPQFKIIACCLPCSGACPQADAGGTDAPTDRDAYVSEGGDASASADAPQILDAAADVDAE
jgi:hypothetical protein